MNDQPQTTTDRYLRIVKDRPLVACTVILFVALVGIGSATEAVNRILTFVRDLPVETGFSISGEIVPEMGASVPRGLLVTVLWQIEDDTAYQSSVVSSGATPEGNLGYSIVLPRPPPDELLHDLGGGVRLGVGFIVAFTDGNHNRIFDSADTIVGGVNGHAVTYLEGDLASVVLPNPRDEIHTLRKLPQGYALTEAVSEEEHGLPTCFDDLVPTGKKSVNVTIPRKTESISFPNWS